MMIFEQMLTELKKDYVISDYFDADHHNEYFDDLFSEARSEIERFLNKKREIIRIWTPQFKKQGFELDQTTFKFVPIEKFEFADP